MTSPPRRLRGLARTEVLGREVRVASTVASRLLGLTLLDQERAGTGLLIPRCRSIHTFGMRFPIEVIFLDESEAVVRRECEVGPGRVLFEAGARSVLELSPHEGEKVIGPGTQSVDGSRAGRDSEDRSL